MSIPICEKCNYQKNHCRCNPVMDASNGKILESPPLSTEPTEAAKNWPSVVDANKKAQEIENQKFLIRMNDRITAWKKANGKLPIPIYIDSNGKYWWANREQRKKFRKAEKLKQKRAEINLRRKN